MGVTDKVRGECLVGVSGGTREKRCRNWGVSLSILWLPPEMECPKQKFLPSATFSRLGGNIYSIFRFVFQASPTGHKFEANKATMVRQYVTRPFRR